MCFYKTIFLCYVSETKKCFLSFASYTNWYFIFVFPEPSVYKLYSEIKFVLPLKGPVSCVIASVDCKPYYWMKSMNIVKVSFIRKTQSTLYSRSQKYKNEM